MFDSNTENVNKQENAARDTVRVHRCLCLISRCVAQLLSNECDAAKKQIQMIVKASAFGRLGFMTRVYVCVWIVSG